MLFLSDRDHFMSVIAITSKRKAILNGKMIFYKMYKIASYIFFKDRLILLIVLFFFSLFATKSESFATE